VATDLTVIVVSRFIAADRAGAAGVVVIDERRARPIHEAGYELQPVASAQAAAVAGLEKAVEVAAEMQPPSVAIRCDNELLVRQVTGAAPLDDEASTERHERVLQALLRLNSWHMAVAEPAEMQRASELAQRTLEEGEAPGEQAEAGGGGPATGEEDPAPPQWVAALLDDPGPRCPARTQPGKRFPFGPETPAGFCVHAAAAAIDDGPLHWAEPAQRRMTTLCPHCDATLRLERVDMEPDDLDAPRER